MAMRAYCGFGHDLPTTLVGAGASVVTTARYQHAGNPSLQIVFNGTTPAYFRMLDMAAEAVTGGELVGFDVAGLTCLAVSGYVRFDSLARCEILSVTDYLAGEMAASLHLFADGTLHLLGDGDIHLATGTKVLALNTWYYIQLTINLGAAGAYALKIDLVDEFSGTGGFGTDEFNDVRFGTTEPAFSDACTFRWANVSVDDTECPATGQRVIVRNIDSEGEYSEFTAGTVAPLWENVSEDPSDGDTTVITTDTIGHMLTGSVSLLSPELPAATPVYGVMCRAISKSDGPGTMELRCMFRSGTTDVQTGLQTVGTSWKQSAYLLPEDPDTSAAWTHAGAIAAEVGVRRGAGSVDTSVVTAVWMEILIGADDYVYPPQAGTTLLAFASDFHAGGTGAYFDHVITALNWIQMHGDLPSALCNAGDLCENTEETVPYHTWIRAAEYGDLDAGIDLIVTPGNWDADELPTAGYGAIPENPYSALLALYPAQFAGLEYGYVDIGTTVRVAFANNNSDYLDDSGVSKYHNCNPPGDQFDLNPDHSGITDPASDARVFLDAVFDNPAPPWRIVMMHRSLWAPFDSDPRKLNRDARAAVLTPIAKGASLVATGDIHVGSISGPWYPAGGPVGDEDALYVAPGGTGAYSLTHAGGYFPRDVDDEVLPNHATTCPWSSGGSTTMKVQVSLVWFEDDGDSATIVIFEASDADPLGSVVYTGTLSRNTAGDGVSLGAESALVARAASHGLGSLVGISPMRFYPNTLPQKCTLPAICYQRLPGLRVRAMHADTGIVRARFWLHLYAADYDDVKALTAQVVAAFNRWSGTVAYTDVLEMRTDDGQDAYEPDLRQHRVTIDLEMDYLEE